MPPRSSKAQARPRENFPFHSQRTGQLSDREIPPQTRISHRSRSFEPSLRDLCDIL